MIIEKITTFAINKSGYAATYTGDGGFERPIYVLIGASGEMYTVDSGLSSENEEESYIPNTGVIWKVTC